MEEGWVLKVSTELDREGRAGGVGGITGWLVGLSSSGVNWWMLLEKGSR